MLKILRLGGFSWRIMAVVEVLREGEGTRLWENGDMVVKIKKNLMDQVGPGPYKHPTKSKGGEFLSLIRSW